MIKLQSDSQKNILFVKMSGILTPLVIKNALPKLQEELNVLSDGYAIVTNISGVADFDPENDLQLRKLHNVLGQKNPQRIIRIVGNAKEICYRFAQFDVENNIKNVEFVPDFQTAMSLVSQLQTTTSDMI